MVSERLGFQGCERRDGHRLQLSVVCAFCTRSYEGPIWLRVLRGSVCFNTIVSMRVLYVSASTQQP